jgi:hypothetical protein
LWLRVLTVVASSLLIPYYAMQPVPLTTAIEWNVVFIVINFYWIVKLAMERRPIQLTPDEARLRDLAFPSLSPREARNLFKAGVWDDLEPSASLIQHDNNSNRFSVILRGRADVVHNAVKIEELGDGQFVGGIDKYASDFKPDLDVIVRVRARVMCWGQQHLQAFLKDRPDVDLALQRSVGLELRNMLDAAVTKLS